MAERSQREGERERYLVELSVRHFLCSPAQSINHSTARQPYSSVQCLYFHYGSLIKQLCELESEIPLLQIIINYGERARRCWTQLYPAQGWHAVIHGPRLLIDALLPLITHPTSVNWALPDDTQSQGQRTSLQTCWRSTDQLRLVNMCWEEQR